jgi:DNA-binding NtrC family response regulator
MVASGAFREDLYYRLNVIAIHVPPLRDRPEDIPALAKHYLSLYADPAAPRRLTPGALAALQEFRWPGNIRQLQNVMHQLAVSAPHAVIDVADLPAEVLAQPALVASPRRERRRATAQRLYDAIKRGADFWSAAHTPYVEHEITRADLQVLIEIGLTECNGNYRTLTALFNMPRSDYRAFLNFLRKEKCLLQFRNFRQVARGR